MKDRFKGKVAWITGGGSGLGEALAYELARQGARVVVSGRRQDRLDQVVARVQELGSQGLGLPCDVTQEEQIEQVVAQIIATWGRLDVAIANAGFGVGGRVEELSAEDWRRQFDTNVVGAAVTLRHALAHLRRVKGRAALIGSVAGTVSVPGTVAYCASKYAVRALGQGLSMELVGTGVSCTTIQPGYVESEIGRVDNQGRLREDWTDRRPGAIMWPADRAARVMVEAIWAREREFTFTGHGKLAAMVGKHAPDALYYGYAGFKRASGLLGKDKG